MTAVVLPGNFLAAAPCLIFGDGGGIVWGWNPNTKTITAVSSGGGATGPANPSASVGLAAVNGSASTFMRSDAAPPLSQGITPTWTSVHTFDQQIVSAVATGTAPFSVSSTTLVANLYAAQAVNVTGTVAIGNGGTGQTTALTGFEALSPMTTTGDMIYAPGAGTATRLPIGTSNQILSVGGGIPGWINQSAMAVGAATNISGGAAGSLPYQTGAGATTFLGIGSSLQVLVTNAGATAPQWVGQSTLAVGIATNIAGGSANQIPYQTGGGTTSFFSASNYGVQTYGATGVPASIAGAAGVLQGSASAIPAFTTTPTLTGTNFSGIPNGALTNSSVTVTAGAGMSGGGAVSLGSSVTLTNAGVTSLAGTGSEITASASTGAVTLTIPAIFVAPGTIQDSSGMYESTTAAITAAGTTLGTATALTTSYNVIGTCAAGKGVSLPVAAKAGLICTVVNQGANTCNVFPGNSTTAIDGASVGVAVTLPVGGTVTYQASSTTQWYTVDPVLIAGTNIAVTYGNGATTVAVSGTVAAATTATNLAGGTANQIPYQTGAGATSFFSAANYGVATYGATGVPAAIAGAAGLLVGSASAIPAFSSSPTIAGTFTAGEVIANGTGAVLFSATGAMNSATSTAFQYNSTLGTANTTLYNGFLSAPTIAASTTLTTLRHHAITDVALGSSAVCTTQDGYYCPPLVGGGTNNRAFHGSIASAPGAWNVYMDGSAANYIAGNLQVGSTTALAGAQNLQVTGTAGITGNQTWGTAAAGVTVTMLAATATGTALAFAGSNAGTNTDNGGSIAFTGGTGLTSGNGGAVTLQGGAAGSTGNGGLASLLGGTTTGGTGGAVAVTAAPAVANGTAGGAASLTAGNGLTSGAGGNVTITAGGSPSGTAGTISQAIGASTVAVQSLAGPAAVTGADFSARGVGICRRATSIETRTSTTTLTNSTQLTFAIPAAGTYAIELVAYLYSTTAVTDGITANINYSGTFTAVGSYYGGTCIYTGGMATAQMTEISSTVNNANTQLTSITLGTNTAQPSAYILSGTLIATASGTLAFAFAESVLGVDTCNLGVGSYMIVTQLS